MKVLILSPHCDDVPFSLGGCLINGYLGEDVEVINMFSKSAYTLNNKGNADIEATTQILKIYIHIYNRTATQKLRLKSQFRVLRMYLSI